MRHGVGWTFPLLTLCGAICVSLLVAVPGPAQVKTGKPLTGMEALRYMNSTGLQAKAEQAAYKILFEDIRQPECLDILARALEIQRKNDDALIWNILLLRVLDDKAAPADVTKYKAGAERRLAGLNKDFEARKARYAESAADKKFTSPENADDLWMTQIQADLTSLRSLNAWKIVGGKKDAKPDWIHNAQGTMHHSGLKFMDSVDERKGVLCGMALKASSDAAKKTGHPTQIKITNVGKCPFLRIGTRAQNGSYILKVHVGGKEIFSQAITEKTWSDLKIDLKDAAGKAEEVTVELTIAEEQRFGDFVWLDYIDFFVN